METPLTANPPQQLRVESSREFSTTPAVLFAAFRDPEVLKQWWGPKGFTNTFKEFDLRPGGKWRFVMHGPNGTDYENEKTFLVVKENERIEFHHHGGIHEFKMTLEYQPSASGTLFKWTMVFLNGPTNEKFKEFILQANEQNFDRLEELLRKMGKV